MALLLAGLTPKTVTEDHLCWIQLIVVTPGSIYEPCGTTSLSTLNRFLPHECVLSTTQTNDLIKQSNTNEDLNNHIQWITNDN